MFYDTFTNICKEKGYSPTSVLQRLNISTSKLTAWKNGSMPNSSFLLPISEFLEVSTDYLLTGKEKNSLEVKLTDDEQEIVNIYRELTDLNKARLTERGQSLLEQQQMQSAYMVAKSTDNAPPRIVKGDFSDVLNAPDATDEY